MPTRGNETPTQCQAVGPLESHSAPVKTEILDPEMLVPPPALQPPLLRHDTAAPGYEALSDHQVAPPSPRLKTGHENFDLPPSPPPLPLVSESLAQVTHDVPSIETGPPLKKSRNIKHMPGQREVDMDPLVSGTADTDLHGEEQMEARQMDRNYSEDEASERSPTKMAPHLRQREIVTQDTSSGSDDVPAAAPQTNCCHMKARKTRSVRGRGSGRNGNRTTRDDGAFFRSEAQLSAPNMKIKQSNRYLFRDDAAFCRYMAHFKDRQLSDCFYFDPEGRIPVMYMDRITEWIDHWQLANLINCQDTYSILCTRIFYTNLQFTDNPYGATSYMFGTVINLSLQNLADIFQVPHTGAEVYINRSWPVVPNVNLESHEKYWQWFDCTWEPGTYQYVSGLPALHQLLYLFINNILTPKITMKTNLERMTMFLLRHFISRDDLSVNVPFFILKHIEKTWKGNHESLPYGNMIHRILRAHNIDPLQAIPAQNTVSPINLLTYLNSTGWIQLKNGNLKPDPNDPINDWILAPNALPNQYWDPDEEPQQEPQLAPEPSPQLGLNPNLMQFLQLQFQGINNRIDMGFTSINNRIDTCFNNRIDTCFRSINNRIDMGFVSLRAEVASLREDTKKIDESVQNLWIDINKRFPSSGSPQASRRF